VDSELTEMKSVMQAKTADLRTCGVMNEFTIMSAHMISAGRSDPQTALCKSR